jgi:hypothetical protein
VRYNYPAPQDKRGNLQVIEGVGSKPRLSPFFYAVSCLFVLVVAVLLGSRIQLTEIMENLNQSVKKLGVLESEELILRTKLENKVSVSNVEEKALALGMNKARKYQIDYVNVSCADEMNLCKD